MSVVNRIDRLINVAVLTVSDTRKKETDKGGQLVQQYLKDLNVEIKEGHYQIVKDDVTEIQTQVNEWLNNDVDAIITTGGTGISQRDVTIEAIKPLLDKEIEGFGEIFRYLSYTEDVGTRAILSRAIAGTVGHQVIISIPGSTGAVKLAMEKLITKELNHLVHELNK
ncbi:MogA/MoaB family molybdenum cofactor biosynthesis protein [Mammaliicoccus sciuri]|jgi:molybdenum cofactor biosynthesis protein B|uniref:MogA/MoaB family molybdenum cofactor biosynthesis protein n=2 Tax=Mammaliicoccus TaxID=2803850 RepID=UPI00065BA4AE|nr:MULTISPECIES: molybdenum cofactor biosynthesis protein B [Mammaliicoccus]PNY94498.1 molybdenum cofactor biosynthesis protein MoaB [Mammaliicoccus sciuri]PTK01202.1 molybdenum cofactor biosynthesis protein MoaB [Mammaliicoccus sciuri]PTK15626.1 molybdenum cofactor biosynthesis protein MoaB [Mammaliicoccus sciuri]RIN86564.1 molybdenum cofactor biosynthesis protein MoaB [Mammaliicoccus sciuri]SQE49772.1 Molybdenum cofactor biosynthesis protein B [Mammaliicoccus sciuri]